MNKTDYIEKNDRNVSIGSIKSIPIQATHTHYKNKKIVKDRKPGMPAGGTLRVIFDLKLLKVPLAWLHDNAHNNVSLSLN